MLTTLGDGQKVAGSISAGALRSTHPFLLEGSGKLRSTSSVKLQGKTGVSGK